jgi:hypothetical protein
MNPVCRDDLERDSRMKVNTGSGMKPNSFRPDPGAPRFLGDLRGPLPLALDDPDLATAGFSMARTDSDPTLADGILDRLAHNAHRIEMRGDSMRKNRKGGS